MSLRKFTLCLWITLFLSACGAPAVAPKPTPMPDPAVPTRALVQGWVDACHALDADKYMSYYAGNAVYHDMSLTDLGLYSRDALDRVVHSNFKQAGFKVEITSFFVSTDGKRAALEGTYYDLNRSGKQVGMPIVILLEIRDGLIIRETDYYDRSPIE